jgi:hypothetical protein
VAPSSIEVNEKLRGQLSHLKHEISRQLPFKSVSSPEDFAASLVASLTEILSVSTERG